MAEVIILAVVKSILNKLVFISGDYALEKIKGAHSVKNDLKIITGKMEAIRAVLKDAESKQFTNDTFKIWLRDLKSVAYDIDDLLDEVAFDAKLRKTSKGNIIRQIGYYASSSSSSSSNPINSRFHLSHKLEKLCEILVNVVAKKNEFGLTERLVESTGNEFRDPLDGSPVYGGNIVGRQEAMDGILAKVNAARNAANLSLLPIVGIGGIGKTTLAKLVYAEVQHFDLKLWVSVSDKFEMRKVIEDIVIDGSCDISPNQNLNTLVKKLHVLLKDKKYFLVLDDVWVDVDDYIRWKDLIELLAIGNAAGSVILITTRNEKLAEISKTGNMEQCKLEGVSEECCWSIFEQLAFTTGDRSRYPHLYEIGKSIIRKCGGVPLVAMTLGSLLRTERDEEEWKRINKMDSLVQLNERYGKVIQLLKLSYDKLPSHIKPCFAYLSLCAKDVDLNAGYVPYLWSALGILQVRDEGKEIEDYGYSYFMELVSRSLLLEPGLQKDIILCQTKMHDLFRDLAINILGEELSCITLNKLDVTEFTRHILWGYEGDNGLSNNTKFPEKELHIARKARTFRFNYIMKHVSQSFLEGIITHLKCLRILDLSYSWFEELPKSIEKMKHLRYLDLSNNIIIEKLPNEICKLLNLEVLFLNGCEKLKEIPRGTSELQSLRKFTMTTCQTSLVDYKVNKLSFLRTLRVESCKSLTSLWESNKIGSLSSLRILNIDDCPKLKCLPTSMKYLVKLEALFITNCIELELKMKNDVEQAQGLQSLRLLHITGVPKMQNIPNGIQSAAKSLKYLNIVNCKGLVELPNWLGSFASLKQIEFEDCPSLVGLPRGMYHLQSMQQLVIITALTYPKGALNSSEKTTR